LALRERRAVVVGEDVAVVDARPLAGFGVARKEGDDF